MLSQDRKEIMSIREEENFIHGIHKITLEYMRWNLPADATIKKIRDFIKESDNTSHNNGRALLKQRPT